MSLTHTEVGTLPSLFTLRHRGECPAHGPAALSWSLSLLVRFPGWGLCLAGLLSLSGAELWVGTPGRDVTSGRAQGLGPKGRQRRSWQEVAAERETGAGTSPCLVTPTVAVAVTVAAAWERRVCVPAPALSRGSLCSCVSERAWLSHRTALGHPG